jgi:preprotein translocase subunit SecD
LNIIFIAAGLAFFGATLTLPGIAGIILIIGMAIDANVLIFERIREELRLGKTPRAAVDGGYSKALVTILDANITTLIAALVLFQFGTGPVKGFAVTLSIGIIASLFTAIFITRLIFDYLIIERGMKKISI